MIDAQINDQPPSLAKVAPNVAPEIVQVVRRCLRKRPSDRYSSAAELIDSLERILHVGGEHRSCFTGDQANRWVAIAKRYAQSRWSARLVNPIGTLGVCAAATLSWRPLGWDTGRFYWDLWR